MADRQRRTTAKAAAPRRGEVACPTVRRGRPPKFGRPSQVIALTLPEEVLDRLRTIHEDPAWAVVQLVEARFPGRPQASRSPAPTPLAELVHLPGGRALIVVQPRIFAGLRGVSTIALADGRAFLAFDRGGGIADLEIAILDRIEELPPRSELRGRLTDLRDVVRAWRRHSGLECHTKSIILVEGGVGKDRRPLAKLETADSSGDLEPPAEDKDDE